MAHVPRIHVPDASPGDERALGASLSHHLVRVLRLREDAPLLAFDGAGHEFQARLLDTGRDAHIQIGPQVREERVPRLAIELWVGVSRRTRMEWTLEKAVELGVTTIRPVLTERSRTRLDDRQAARKLAHWRAVATAAAAQCGRTWLPDLEMPRPLADLWEPAPCDTRLFLSPEAGVSLTSLGAPEGRVALLVGPESGFSEGECRHAVDAGWQPVRLGPRILRAETAGPAALAAIQALWGEWRAEG